MADHNTQTGGQQGDSFRSPLRTSYREVDFTIRPYDDDLQPIARDDHSLATLLEELEKHLNVLRQGGSLALHRGEKLIGTQLLEQVERLFTDPPEVEGPPITWARIILWAGASPESVCSSAQLSIGESQISLREKEREFLRSGRAWRFLSPWPEPRDRDKELRVVKETLADVEKVKDMANKIITEATILQQCLCARRELLSNSSNGERYITTKTAATTGVPAVSSYAGHNQETQARLESDIVMDQPVGGSNPDMQSSHFANLAANEVRGGIDHHPPTVSTDSGHEHLSGLNSQSPQGQSLHSGLGHTISCSEENDQDANRFPSFPAWGASGNRSSQSGPMIAPLNTPSRHAPVANDKGSDSTTPAPNQDSFAEATDRIWIPIFIRRLVKTLNDTSNESIIRWSEDGNTVMIVDDQQFTAKLLPAFNTTTYASFTQQLYMHGFRRVDQGWGNPLFRRDSPESICLIRRKDSKSQPPSSLNARILSPATVANQQVQNLASVPERPAVHGNKRPAISDEQLPSEANDVPSRNSSCGVRYKIIRRKGRKRGRKT